MNFIDLFAGAGGLSEGFIRAGFEPIAHVEIEKSACFTLKTRAAFHYLKTNKKIGIYEAYLKGIISRSELYSFIPDELLGSVINLPIGNESNKIIQNTIDAIAGRREVDLIIGGPPCQAYSVVGRARSSNSMEGDLRNYLYVFYAEYLRKYKPKVFVFENVLGLKSAGKGKYLKDMEAIFLSEGYEIKLYTLEANNFGVLQNRKRVIIIGWIKEHKVQPPDLEKIRISLSNTVNDVLKDLPELMSGDGIDKFFRYSKPSNNYLDGSGIRNGINVLTQHVARPHTEQDKEIYRIAVSKWNEKKERLYYNDLPERLKTHRNRHSFYDRFKVVASENAHSQTIVAHIAKDGHYYIHPDIEQNRSLTVREAARLQSFPDDYYFEGEKEGNNRTPAFRQIGNAVPPLMAHRIAEEIKNVLEAIP